MPIYTNARQFPHLAGKSDAEIRRLARQALEKHPGLIRAMRLRDVIIIFGMTTAGVLLGRLSSLGIGAILMLLGAAGSLFILCWNLVWVNQVLYKLTQHEAADAAAR
ncbi:MAG TPA: hypothetical protein VHY91_19705 [Pirellulales bacterium]|jgi:hypothetical protein|nr:hypothetical protein [Pirellulales bacterium]